MSEASVLGPRTQNNATVGTPVVIVTDDPALAHVLEVTLAPEGYVLERARDSAEVVRIWTSDPPAMAVVDGSLRGVDGFALVERLRGIETAAATRAKGSIGHVPIILLTGSGNTEEKIRALRVGADEALAKPLLPGELRARMRGLLARHTAVRGHAGPGKLLVFYGAKGGAGTTTVAINVAIALQRGMRRRVALVDGKLQFGDHRIVLDFGLDKPSIADLLDAPGTGSHHVQKVLVEHASGIDALLAPPTPATAARIKPEFALQVLTDLLHLYEIVVVDIDQRLDELNLLFMDMADAIFIITTSDIMSLKNVGQLYDSMDSFGYSEQKVRLVLNRSNAFTGVTASGAEQALHRRIDYQLPNEYNGAISALNDGAPIMLGHANSALGRALTALAKIIDAIPAQTPPATITTVPAPIAARSIAASAGRR